MDSRNIYQNISPLDHRYYTSNREIFDQLSRYLSEEASVTYSTRVEAALLKTHINTFLDGRDEYHQAVDKLEDLVGCEEVYAEEEKTQHNIRALVNVIKRYLPEELHPYVHLGATSVDILDTGMSLRIRESVRRVLLPALLDAEEQLITIAEEYARTPQIGRTHGQHAVPITVGFTFAEYIARLGKSISRIEKLSKELKGKLSGAVGAYNATSLMVPDPIAFEKQFCDFLHIHPSQYSNQLIEPEYLLRLLLEINISFGIIANLADDMRNLQRSEIGELHESFKKDQVGSSTMPHKRNPWNSEHIKSLWKAFSPRIVTFCMDQISEHQRDLTNSASSRFVADYLAGFAAAVNRLNKVLGNLAVDTTRTEANMRWGGDLVLSEAAYILLAIAGDTNAHEKMRKITLRCNENNTNLIDELKQEKNIWPALEKQLQKTIGTAAEDFFSDSSFYCGKAVEKTVQIIHSHRENVDSIRRSLSSS
jgi:adenylosuccinate lyase